MRLVARQRSRTASPQVTVSTLLLTVPHLGFLAVSSAMDKLDNFFSGSYALIAKHDLMFSMDSELLLTLEMGLMGVE